MLNNVASARNTGFNEFQAFEKHVKVFKAVFVVYFACVMVVRRAHTNIRQGSHCILTALD